MLEPQYSSDCSFFPKVHHCSQDHLGTPQAMTDAARNIVWEADYEPFGKVKINVEQVVNNFRFPGQYEDGESGLNYNWWRYYSYLLGRFPSPDPIFSTANEGYLLLNILLAKNSIERPRITAIYSYSNNRPTSVIDLNGLWPMGLDEPTPEEKEEAKKKLKEYVPDLTDDEASQIIDDVIEEAGWSDVPDALSAALDGLPDSLDKATEKQKKFLNDFLDRLPSKHKEAIDKIRNKKDKSQAACL